MSDLTKAQRAKNMTASLRLALFAVDRCRELLINADAEAEDLAEYDAAAEGLRMTLQDWLYTLTPAAPSSPARRNRAMTNSADAIECHGLDTPDRVCFYEQDFYVLSNFSAFSLQWRGFRFDTLEHAYHWEKFPAGPSTGALRADIRNAISAHEAFRIAQANKDLRRPDWDDVKVDVMRNLLREKVAQHEYVRRKLLATGGRLLVENSWRDDFWGWGPNRDGKNMLGKLWMEIRAALEAPDHG